MPQVKPDIQTFARIKVVGVGGSGCHALARMMSTRIEGVEFIAVNTDAQDLHSSNAPQKIHIGKNLTRGLGTGMNAELGKRAAEETKEEIQESIKGSDMVFITGGMGGGTCTGASSVIAKTATNIWHGRLWKRPTSPSSTTPKQNGFTNGKKRRRTRLWHEKHWLINCHAPAITSWREGCLSTTKNYSVRS